MVSYIRKTYKSVLIKRKYIDSWFWDRYGINCYNGCQFACIYCDSRSLHYHMPSDFENEIYVKENIAGILDKRISNARTLMPDIVGLSGVSDPYQPAEKKYKNTHNCLEILHNHKYPVHIITKSPLVLDDLDILNAIGQQSACIVSITVTTSDNKKAGFLEKNVPTPEKRFNIINQIKKRTEHIHTGVLYIPVVPFVTDTNEEMEAMVKETKISGADYMLFGGGMTMRDQMALWFLDHIKKVFPELIPEYEQLYSFKYDEKNYTGAYTPRKSYALEKNRFIKSMCEKYDLPYRIKRFIPEDFRKWNYLISEKLLNRAYDLQIEGKASSQIYWAGMNIQNLKESIVEITERNNLKSIRNVDEKIASYIIECIDNE